MKRSIYVGLLGLGLMTAGVSQAAAQDGFALKGGAVFNRSSVDSEGRKLDLSDAAGWSLGAEVVLPLGLGVGISGYTSGSPNSFDVSEGSLLVLGEANYFLKLPMFPVAPYAGLHVGLGTYTLDDVENRVRPEVDFGDLGYQLGVRFQATPVVGIDAQFRRVSGSLAGEQDASFENNQVLIGITVF